MSFLAKVNDELELLDHNGQRTRYLGWIIEAEIIGWEVASTKLSRYHGRIIGEDVTFIVNVEKNCDADRAFATFHKRPIWIWVRDGEFIVEPSHYGRKYRGPR